MGSRTHSIRAVRHQKLCFTRMGVEGVEPYCEDLGGIAAIVDE
jgi:hypothetical protein